MLFFLARFQTLKLVPQFSQALFKLETRKFKQGWTSSCSRDIETREDNSDASLSLSIFFSLQFSDENLFHSFLRV